MEIEEAADTCLCFDANLPKMDTCGRNCGNNTLILCCHRFNFKVKITYCNGRRFSGVSDLSILYYFLDYIRDEIDAGSVRKDALFIILTKDANFLKDAEAEWSRKTGLGEPIFNSDHVICGDLVVFTYIVNCKNYGTRDRDDLKYLIYKMNKLKKRPKV